MKAIYLVCALSAALSASAQSPSTPQGQDLFQFAPSAPAQPQPRFQFHLPGGKHQFNLRGPLKIKPAPEPPSFSVDPQILRRPQGFAQHPGKPLLQNLYPGLTLMPTETASLNAPPRAIPIPRTFPKSKLEPIPTKWPDFTMVPIDKP
jgi:hypothetical protein